MSGGSNCRAGWWIQVLHAVQRAAVYRLTAAGQIRSDMTHATKVHILRLSPNAPNELSFIPPFAKGVLGEDVTIRELAETVKQVVGYMGEIVFDATKPDGTPRKLMDVARLHNLGWRESVKLRAGISSAYKTFFQDNYQ